MIGIRADDLAAQVVKALLERQPDLPLDEIDDVVLGCAFPEHTQGMLMARGVALLAGHSARVGRQGGQSLLRLVDGRRAPALAGDPRRRRRVRHRGRRRGHVRHSDGRLQPVVSPRALRDGLLHRHGRDRRDPGRGSRRSRARSRRSSRSAPTPRRSRPGRRAPSPTRWCPVAEQRSRRSTATRARARRTSTRCARSSRPSSPTARSPRRPRARSRSAPRR